MIRRSIRSDTLASRLPTVFRAAPAFVCAAFWGCLLLTAPLHGAQAPAFEQAVQPVLKEFCINCHSTEKQKGDLDLERFTSLDLAKAAPSVWERSLEQIRDDEMPPKNKPKPSPAQLKTLTDWMQGTLDGIALASAGDPGPVVLRRLSNMEYTYSLRDLTGVDSLDPAREFPVDGAAGEGFTNAGAALVMSPALLTKYLDAAKQVAAHMVLLPDGIRFSPSTSAQDWTNETLDRIRSLYARHSGTAKASETTQQGIKLDIGDGSGRLPLQSYLDALQGRRNSEGLSPKYLALLKSALTAQEPDILLDPLREAFSKGKLSVADIEPWQNALWRFTQVGHIGKQNGPKAWQEPVTPLSNRFESRIKLTGATDTILYLTATDAGDGTAGDDVLWNDARLVSPGRPDIPVSSIDALVAHLASRRDALITSAEQCLGAIAAGSSDAPAEDLLAWREYLGFGTTKLEPLLSKKMNGTPDYAFIKGWNGDNALSVLANSSDATVRTPGTMKAHSVATHPSPKQASVIAWKSPAKGVYRISGDVSHAHPECGNGITWALEIRRGMTTEVLASGFSERAKILPLGPFEKVPLDAGQVVAIVIGPRDGNHSCDLTAVNLAVSDGTRTSDLAADVSPDILKGNPHGPWHFLSQSATQEGASDLPAPIAAWRRDPSAANAAKVRAHLQQEFPLTSRLLSRSIASFRPASKPAPISAKAPSITGIHIPAALTNGSEFVVTGTLAPESSGSVQLAVLTKRPEDSSRLIAGQSQTVQAKGQWSDNNLVTHNTAPIVVRDNSPARQRFEKSFEQFRNLFPVALCYTKIVPVDEVVTLTLFYREDDHLRRLILSDDEARELDRLWDELRFVSESPLKQVAAFEQLWQFATQDAKPSAFEPMRKPIMEAAAAFQTLRESAQPPQKEAVAALAARAWRRPLTAEESAALNAFPPHLMLVRILTSPAFLYRAEKVPQETAVVSPHELATRLSYFLWAAPPDQPLRALADSGRISEPAVLASEVRRLLKDERVRRLATEFGCQWLHVRDLATLGEKSERHFPSFISVRASMQEEVTRFLTDLIQNNAPVTTLLTADHTFIDGPLAAHYGLPEEQSQWHRVEGLRKKGRGGVLGFAATLSKQSGASRTSPILRGNWVSEVLLGERLPRPPKDVPILPEEAPEGLTERQLIERHSSDERCSGCHKRIDPFGFALEAFDPIGRARDRDSVTTLTDGTRIEGLSGLRDYLASTRRQDFLRQFNRKLLGYALGRSVQLSDKTLVDELTGLPDARLGDLVEHIVLSPQFRKIRGAAGRDAE